MLLKRSKGSKLGLLAGAAGIRPETLHRIENDKPNVRTIEKIDRALRRAASKRRV